METIGMQDRACVTAVVCGDQRQGGAEKLSVISFVRFPNRNSVVEVFREIDQDAGNFAKRFGIQTKGIVGELTLRVGENPTKLLYGPRKVRVTSSLIPQRTVF